MSARILDGRAFAAELWREIEARAAALRERRAVPRLAIVRAGEDPASVAYQRQITRAFTTHGLQAEPRALPAGCGQRALEQQIDELSRDPSFHGILLQLPLPQGIRSDLLIDRLPLHKDIEGLHPYHAGLLALGKPSYAPSTPLAGMEILRRGHVGLAGRLAVVVGRSPIVGRPMAAMLLQANCTVIVCHSRTPDLGQITRQGEVLVAAVGQPRLITGSMLKPGAVVIDFGTTEVDGRLVGDVDFESVADVAGAITPVPGGTGPVTTAVLARSLCEAASQQLGD